MAPKFTLTPNIINLRVFFHCHTVENRVMSVAADEVVIVEKSFTVIAYEMHVSTSYNKYLLLPYQEGEGQVRESFKVILHSVCVPSNFNLTRLDLT